MVGTVICRLIVDFMWLVKIFDGGWNTLFEGTLDCYSCHSVQGVSPSRREKVVMVV